MKMIRSYSQARYQFEYSVESLSITCRWWTGITMTGQILREMSFSKSCCWN